jgi:hypothetical protein
MIGDCPRADMVARVKPTPASPASLSVLINFIGSILSFFVLLIAVEGRVEDEI